MPSILEPDDFKTFCAEQRWFHSIDFGDVVSSGRFPKGQPQNSTLLPTMELLNAMDLVGASVLDIGTVDGLIAFGAVKLGAESVIATDSVRRSTFERGAKKLEVEVDYRPGLQIKDLVATFGEKSFDVIICAGVIYHMLNPFSAFSAARHLVKDQGYVIFESAVAKHGDEPALYLNSESERGHKELYTYWMPTPSAMVGMAKLCSFNPIATRLLKSPVRFTVMAQAVHPDAVSERSQQLKDMHEADFCDFEFQLARLFAPEVQSHVTVATIEPYRVIDSNNEQIAFPHHPASEAQTVGRTAWLNDYGNFRS